MGEPVLQIILPGVTSTICLKQFFFLHHCIRTCIFGRVTALHCVLFVSPFLGILHVASWILNDSCSGPHDIAKHEQFKV